MSKRKLRVFFDVYELAPGVGKSVGIYNYAKNLFKTIVEIADENIEFIAICNGACKIDFTSDSSRVKTIVVSDGVPSKIRRLFWLYIAATLEIRRQKADFYFSPKGFLPHGLGFMQPSLETVVVVHDLIPLWYAENYPGYFGYIEQFIVNRGLIYTLKKANKVIAISNATSDEIRKKTSRKDVITVVHNGVPYTIPGAPPTKEPYIFAMSSNLPHKNSKEVVDAYLAYRKLVANPLPLLLCGASIDETVGVVVLNNLTDEQLHGCYANAELFVFLSKIEGFGFPPIEAMMHGTAVLCADIPVLREVTRGEANYVPTIDTDYIGEKIAELLDIKSKDKSKDKHKLIEAVSIYTWENCANGVLEVLKSKI